MIYVVSNIYGNYAKLQTLFRKIEFSENDLLYVLGDMVDYGEESMETVCDLSVRSNVYPVCGDHDVMACRMLSGFDAMLKKGSTPDESFIADMQKWVSNGGQPTLDGFRALDQEMKEGVLDYLSDIPPYEIAETEDGRNFLLVHSGIRHFVPGQDPEDYDPADFYEGTLDTEKMYFKKTGLIVGHTEIAFGQTSDSGLCRKGNLIALHSGAVPGLSLNCLCLDNGQEYSV